MCSLMLNALLRVRTGKLDRKPKALVVEDDQKQREATVAEIEDAGFDVEGAKDKTSALDYLRSLGDRLDLLVVDLHLGEDNLGWWIIAEAKPRLPHWCEIVVLTAFDETKAAADSAGVTFVMKGSEYLRF